MFSNTPVICEDAEKVVFDGGSILHLILWGKNIRWQDTGLKCIRYVISDFRGNSDVFDEYAENPTTTDNTHKCSLTCYFKNDAFLRNTSSKYLVINGILTELKKSGCNEFHLYDNTDIDITKLNGQSSVKYLTIEISENEDLLVLLMYHASQNSKSLYFKSNKK